MHIFKFLNGSSFQNKANDQKNHHSLILYPSHFLWFSDVFYSVTLILCHTLIHTVLYVLFLVFIFSCTRDYTQGFTYVRHVLYQWTTPLELLLFLWSHSSIRPNMTIYLNLQPTPNFWFLIFLNIFYFAIHFIIKFYTILFLYYLYFIIQSSW